MGDAVLGTTTKEKDLGVTFSADMKVSEQCGIAASKVNQILGQIKGETNSANSVDMFKNRIDRYLIRAGYTQMIKIVGLSISQWLPCPLAIWNL